MTIRINQIAVDFTLEKEKTVADLTASLRAWAHGQNLAILGILGDGRALGPEDTSLLTTLKVVDVEAVPAGEKDLARVAVIARFFAFLSQGWRLGDQELIGELHSEYSAVRGALFPLLSSLERRLADPLKHLDGPWTDPEALGAAALQVAGLIETRRQELQSPVHALRETLSSLEGATQALSELSLLFQKGQDRDAFDRIVSLFTLLEDGARRAELYFQHGGTGLENWTMFHQELKPFLREAEAALVAGDYILLTDLLEYEVTPRILGMKELFPEVLNLDPAQEVL